MGWTSSSTRSASTWPDSVRCLRPGGRLVVFGATGGARAELEVRPVYFGQISILGTTMGSPRDFASLLRTIDVPGWRPVIDSVRPLAEAAAAHERMEAGAHFGKLVLEIAARRFSRVRPVRRALGWLSRGRDRRPRARRGLHAFLGRGLDAELRLELRSSPTRRSVGPTSRRRALSAARSCSRAPTAASSPRSTSRHSPARFDRDDVQRVGVARRAKRRRRPVAWAVRERPERVARRPRRALGARPSAGNRPGHRQLVTRRRSGRVVRRGPDDERPPPGDRLDRALSGLPARLHRRGRRPHDRRRRRPGAVLRNGDVLLAEPLLGSGFVRDFDGPVQPLGLDQRADGVLAVAVAATPLDEAALDGPPDEPIQPGPFGALARARRRRSAPPAPALARDVARPRDRASGGSLRRQPGPLRGHRRLQPRRERGRRRGLELGTPLAVVDLRSGRAVLPPTRQLGFTWSPDGAWLALAGRRRDRALRQRPRRAGLPHSARARSGCRGAERGLVASGRPWTT